MSNDFDLASIRVNTEHDLADAQNLAARWLAQATDGLDFFSTQFSNDLLVAIALHLAYKQKGGSLLDVLDFLLDPGWQFAKQAQGRRGQTPITPLPPRFPRRRKTFGCKPAAYNLHPFFFSGRDAILLP